MKINKNTIKKIEEITMTDYGFNEKGETNNWDVLVEDLIKYYEDLQEEYNNYKEREITKYDIEN